MNSKNKKLKDDFVKEGQPKTIRLVDYEAPGYVTRETDLTFDIKAGETRVYSSLKVERNKVGDSEIFLSGNQADLISVKLDGRVLLGNEYELSEEKTIDRSILSIDWVYTNQNYLAFKALLSHLKIPEISKIFSEKIKSTFSEKIELFR